MYDRSHYPPAFLESSFSHCSSPRIYLASKKPGGTIFVRTCPTIVFSGRLIGSSAPKSSIWKRWVSWKATLSTSSAILIHICQATRILRPRCVLLYEEPSDICDCILLWGCRVSLSWKLMKSSANRHYEFRQQSLAVTQKPKTTTCDAIKSKAKIYAILQLRHDALLWRWWMSIFWVLLTPGANRHGWKVLRTNQTFFSTGGISALSLVRRLEQVCEEVYKLRQFAIALSSCYQ